MVENQFQTFFKLTITRKLLLVVIINLLMMGLIGTYAVNLMTATGKDIEESVLAEMPKMSNLDRKSVV